MRIPPQNMEIERIYTQLARNEYHVIAISSANKGEGVTSVALALTHRSLLAGNKTLLIDLNLHRPALNKLMDLEVQESANRSFEIPKLVTVQDQSIALQGITAPTRRDLVIKLRKPGVLEQYIEQWQKSFDTIIFDTSPINRNNAGNIPAERVAAACDGVLLVVHAGHTNEAMVSTAVKKIRLAGGELLGCILNDRDNPTLKSELLRETQRLEPRFSYFANLIRTWLRNNRLLSTEV